MLSLFRRRKPGPAPGWPDPAAALPADCRLYAIGDVHGRADRLAPLLDLITADHAARDAADPGRRLIIAGLGDYIDRGEASRAVLDLLMLWRDRLGTDAFPLLAGNHEAALRDFLADPEAGAAWLSFGGLQTLASYGVPLPGPTPRARAIAARALAGALGPHRALIAGLLPWHRIGDVLLVHAGADPDRPLAAQGEAEFLWGRSRFLSAGGPPGLLTVHGHVIAPEPMLGRGRIGVDTGAWAGGPLTALRLDGGGAGFLQTPSDRAGGR